MKKTLLTITALLTLSSGFAQAPDFGFETWVNAPLGTLQDPTGWATFNSANLLGMNQTVFKDNVAPYAGSFSAKVVTDVLPGALGSIPNPLSPGQTLSTVGLLVTGKIAVIPSPVITYGYQYTARPAALTFACKYAPVGNDTAFVYVFLTKQNGATKDTVAYGEFKTGAASTSFSPQTLTLTYNSGISPDSELVIVSSSIIKGTGAQVGSAFNIDALGWTGWNSTSDIMGEVNSVSYFPNPATNVINFKSSLNSYAIEVTDITGRSAGIYVMKNNETKIQTENFSPGLYIYSLLNDKKEVLNRGRFEVTR